MELDISVGSAEMVAAELASLGMMVEVIGPAEARQYLARLGAELAERYRGPQT